MTTVPAARRVRRRRIAPEVVQTSAMDCGPAALTCLLSGHGISSSFGRLREACQTSVDGTSIDTLEELAREMGLDAEQVMVPVDHVLLPEAATLPALAVVRLPSGFTHFVVLWSRMGPWVQVMDPATGRRWMRCGELERDLYVHAQAVPAALFREWAGSAELLGPLGRRLGDLGVDGEGREMIARAVADPGARGLASLDAAARMGAALVAADAVPRGEEAVRMVAALWEEASSSDPARREAVPAAYWSAAPAPDAPDGAAQVLLRGAVLLRVHGVLDAPGAARSPEVEAALREPPARPFAELRGLLRLGGAGPPATVVAAGTLAAVAGVLEALLLRSLLDLSSTLGLPAQRGIAIALAALATAILLGVDLCLAAECRRVGRGLEIRLRRAFLAKLPRLPDRYLQSRPTSDMAARAHAIHAIRQLPEAAARLLYAALTIVVAAAAIAWIDPASTGLALLAVLLAFVLPLLFVVPLTERDMRLRVHAGALGRFYLDAMLGQTPIRTHGAEPSVRREHEGLLSEWMRSARSLVDAVVAMEALRGLLGLAVALALVRGYVARGADAGGILLLTYWSLAIVGNGHEVLRQLRQYPTHRNNLLRLLEPLGALDDAPSPEESSARSPEPGGRGAAIRMEGVDVVSGGHAILTGIELHVEPGRHVAVVGPSGAGKSSLLGLLLGFHRAAAGSVTVDGAALRGDSLARVRRETAWVDPAVQLWNRSLLENLLYGGDPSAPVGAVLERADLGQVLESLPEGLQTALGEGGGLLSGGEGQRVRFARALARQGARLVLLDEPFRGLEGARRRELTARAREHWSAATMLCVTHDVADTLGFPRVLVVEGGRIVEDGPPAELRARAGSRYRALLEAEEGTWEGEGWRRIVLREGELVEPGAP